MDGDQLKQLASSLGECSNIVNRILSNSNEQPTRESSSSTSSPSTVDNNTVANTVGRARLMLQRSTMAGLCSRLNQREVGYFASCDWVASCELRVASCELRVASCELRAASCELRAASCELRAASCELWVASCESLASLWIRLWKYIINMDDMEGKVDGFFVVS
jgi:hypothetical protein